MSAAPSVPAAPQQPQRQISDFGRVGGVLFSPGATFTDIARKPSWIVPVALLTILSLVAVYFVSQKMDWQNFIRHQDEQSSRFQNLSDEQKDNAVNLGAKIAPAIAWGFGAAWPILRVVVLALFCLLAFNILVGAQLRFATAMGIVSYAYVPALVASLLVIAVAIMKPYGELDPQRMLATSLTAFLGADAPKWELTAGTSIELFLIWTLILIALGFSKANPKKISFGTGFGVVFGLWALYLLISTGLTAAFS